MIINSGVQWANISNSKRTSKKRGDLTIDCQLSFMPLQMLKPETPCVSCFLFIFSLEVIRSFAHYEPAHLIKVENAVYGNDIWQSHKFWFQSVHVSWFCFCISSSPCHVSIVFFRVHLMWSHMIEVLTLSQRSYWRILSSVRYCEIPCYSFRRMNCTFSWVSFDPMNKIQWNFCRTSRIYDNQSKVTH